MIQKILSETVRKAIADACDSGELNLVEIPEPMFERPNLKEHGDWSTNIAMVLASTVKANPRQIAQTIHKNLRYSSEYIRAVDIAGPGFINFHLSSRWLYTVLKEVEERKDTYGRSTKQKPEYVQIEFVSANPVGPMHIGHGRWAALGDVLATVMDWAGDKIFREFYINDYGNQMELFALSVAARYAQEFGIEEEIPENGYQGEYIKDIAREIIANDADAFLLEDADVRHRELKERAYSQVLRHMEGTLAQMGVHFDRWFSESELHDNGAVSKVIDELKNKGLAYENDGALWLRTTDFGDDKDRVLIRENGQPTYFAADIAYHHDKFARNFDRVINIWGADHHGYIARMKAAVAAMGVDPDRLEIIIGQLVNLLRGGQPVRMSKRTGEMVTLDELIEEVGVDAVRYLFLMRGADSAMDFDIEVAKQQTNDNPVFYIQYAHARIASILRFAEQQGVPLKKTDDVYLELLDSEAEIALIKKIAEFEEVIVHCAEARAPHLLPKYAQELANVFHVFYTRCRVIGEEQDLSEARMVLVDCARIVLKNVLTVCGVSAPDSM